jgi:hypothetical protein
MCVYRYTCISICIYAYTYTSTHTHTHTHTYAYDVTYQNQKLADFEEALIQEREKSCELAAQVRIFICDTYFIDLYNLLTNLHY